MLSIPGYTILEKIPALYYQMYRGFRDSDKKTVLLKLPLNEHPSNKEISNTLHEYQLLKNLESPNIIRVHELIESQHYPILVLEDVQGHSLKSYILNNPLDLNVFFKLAIQIIDILAVLHQKNIIHKDIKPINIFIDPITLDIKLIDFSIASQLSEENLNYISLNALEGTLPYISPEQTGRMNRPLDYRTDFYSLGITFFEMLTSQLPFEANDALEMVHCHIAKIPPLATEFNTQIPTMVAALIAKLLEKMPENRYANARGIKEDMLTCMQEWQEHKKIPIFELGKNDIQNHLQISHKLYGREIQIKKVLTAFERVSLSGKCEALMVTGYSGIGKSATIKEVYKPIVKKKGYFINGKYDQLQSDSPYTAIIDALQSLVRQVLSDSKDKVEQIRQELQENLGNLGQVIINLVPESELIIGPQPPIESLSAAETRNRFNMVFENFVRVFAKETHPLVMFLDDLQWADSASLDFIENIFTNPNTHYLFLIGAYRDNEVTIDHPLLGMLQRLQKADINVETIVLQPLEIDEIKQLLTDTFMQDNEAVTELAELLREKTLGNPFFICEFLKALYQAQQIKLDYENGIWKWDIEKIKSASMTLNVIELLTAQIHRLPENTQHILKLAACIGHTFSLQTLITISEQDSKQVAQELWKAMQTRFIMALGDSNRTAILAENKQLPLLPQSEVLYYQFSHDRIQQAAYSLIHVATRKQIHLMIGRLLLKKHILHENDNQLFTIINHFNNGIELLKDLSENKLLAKYNVWAGRKAKASAAYGAALTYFQAAEDLLPSSAWTYDYNLSYSLHKDAVECEYLLTHFEAAEKRIALLLQKAHPEDKTVVYLIQIKAYSSTSKNQQALQIAEQALKTNFSIMLNPTKRNILKEMLIINWKTRGNKIHSLANELPIATDARIIDINLLLSAMLPPAFVISTSMYALLTCKLINLALIHGYTQQTTLSCLTYASILISRFDKIEKGYDFVSFSQTLENRLLNKRPSTINYMVLGGLLSHWKSPLEVGLTYQLKARQLALEEGDVSLIGHSYASTHALYFIGRELSELAIELDKAIAFTQRINQKNACLFYSLFRKSVDLLINGIEIDDDYLNLLYKIDTNAKFLWALSYMMYSQIFYFKGEVNRALEYSTTAWDLKSIYTGTINTVFLNYMHALCICSSYPSLTNAQKKSFAGVLKQIHGRIRLWSLHAPDNFSFLYLHISAEMARIHNSLIEAMSLYDQAISTAHRCKNFHFSAIINERAALFYLELEKPHMAKHYMVEAHYFYQRWGALGKCKLLEKNYSHLLEASSNALSAFGQTTTSSLHSFDMVAALKSTLAISSEIKLDKLLLKLIHIMLEDAGAERCSLLSKQDDEWVNEADADNEKQTIFLQPQPIAATTNLPLTLINYVQCTEEPIIIQDAVHEEQTMSDPYVIKNSPKSMLVLPIRYQGQLRRIFYLENNLTKGAFIPNHLQLLQLIGTQAAISLENARLYYQATHDPLTGLANRNLLYQTFEESIAPGKLATHEKIAILFLDLNFFKIINDTLGHEVGDKVLLHVSEQLKFCINEADLAVRLGGDEFVLMINKIKDIESIEVLTKKLNECLAKPVHIQGNLLHISTSIGISVYPNDGKDMAILLNKADINLYQDKKRFHKEKEAETTVS